MLEEHFTGCAPIRTQPVFARQVVIVPSARSFGKFMADPLEQYDPEIGTCQRASSQAIADGFVTGFELIGHTHHQVFRGRGVAIDSASATAGCRARWCPRSCCRRAPFRTRNEKRTWSCTCKRPRGCPRA